MKCPSCNYRHGWDPKWLDIIGGEKGDFYQLRIEMRKFDNFAKRETVFGCPACGKVFLNIGGE